MQWVDCQVGKELMGQSHPEGSGQWLRVLIDISNINSVLQGSLLEPMLFNMFINDIE